MSSSLPDSPSLASPSLQPLIPSAMVHWSSHESISARALIVGERLSLKDLERINPLATNPLIVKAGAHGCVVLLRYGVIVTFDLSPTEEAEFIAALQPNIRDPFQSQTSEELPIAFRPMVKERLEAGVLWLQDWNPERLQIVAEALGKSVVLDYYEGEVSSLFGQIKPFTTAIQGRNLRPPKEQELLSYVGGTLLIQQKMLGIVEVGEKPDPIWDHPELDRLYLRLEDEYELRERLVSLEQKLALISKTVETSLGIMQRDSSHRVEWYIVILIVVEIVLSIYEIWMNKTP